MERSGAQGDVGDLWEGGPSEGPAFQAKRQVFHHRRQRRQLPQPAAAPKRGEDPREARSPLELRRAVFAPHGLAFQVEAVGVVDQAIQDGVGEGRVAEGVVPDLGFELAGDES